MDIFRDIEPEDQKKNIIRPEILSNTAFITEKPDPIKNLFIEKYDKFLDFYGWSQTKFDKELFYGNNMYNRFKRGDYDPTLRTAQRILEDIYEYDKQRNPKAKNRCFKRIRKKSVRENILDQLDLFCARNMVSETDVSLEFLGFDNIIAMFRINAISFRFSRIDKLLNAMHEEDMALIAEMGPEYDRWKRTQK